MTVMVRDLPEEERPREKFIRYGASALSNAELLAILLRTGMQNKSVLHVAADVLAKFRERGLQDLIHMMPEEMTDIPGLGLTKAVTILAAVELGRRLHIESTAKATIVHGPEDAAAYLMPRLEFERKEHFVILLLNTKNHITGMRNVSTGSLSASVVHPREVFLEAIHSSAAAIILSHNHPSGDPSPSREDIAVTQRLQKAGKILDIPVLDHIIIGEGRFVSMKEQGYVAFV